jgi:hypothetical protein
MSETNLAKIAITASSDNDLSGALDRVNRDFEGGRVTKTDMASWLILRAISTLDEAAIEEIRKAHFNQVVYLESLVRKLKSAGRDNLGPEELATLQSMLGQQSTKRHSRPQKPAEMSAEKSK